MTIRGERAITRLYRAPASGRFADESPLDSGTVIRELDSNLAHLCEESVRHLAWDFGETGFADFTDNDFTGLASVSSADVVIPSAAEATHAWQQIAWDNRSARRFGPFVLVPDVGDRPVAARPRSVRVVVELKIPAGLTNCHFAAVLTRGSHPDEIYSGRYIAAYEQLTVASGSQTIRCDLDPDARSVVDGSYAVSRTLPSAPAGSQSTAHTPVRTFYLWVGMVVTSVLGASTVEVLSVSAYETRE